MIFAKVDVKLRDHLRAHRAGAAMATWTWALLYSREQETDGDIYAEVLRGSWVGESTALEHAAKLVEVGLWDVIDGGWRIRNYSAKNETKEAIDEKRRGDRMRKRKGGQPSSRPEPPSGIQPESDRSPCGAHGGSVVGIPGSYSSSLSGSGSREGESEREPASPPPPSPLATVVADPASPEPSWWEGVLETVNAGTGVALPAREAWLRYAGHRASKTRPAERRDAVHWLTTVMVKEAREDRDKARHRSDRDAKFDRDREKQRDASAPPAPYHRTYKPPEEGRASPEEQAAAMRKLTETLGGVVKTGT